METPPSFKNMILLGTNIVSTTLADTKIPTTVKTFSEVKVFPVSTYVTNIARDMTGIAIMKSDAFNARNLDVLLILSLSCLQKYRESLLTAKIVLGLYIF